MAGSDSSAFSCWDDIPDDTKFVYQAMATLGFLCEFSELSVGQQQIALALAQQFKCCQRTPETWES
jgi:hypothetical protein